MKIESPDHTYIINSISDNVNAGHKDEVKIFLAGTIDNGDSNNWQHEMIEYINYSFDANNIIVFNPRCNYWPDNENDIVHQIEWEQKKLDEADYIFMNFEPNSKSPISLLELGLYAQSKKLYVFCDRRFYRFANVRLTCDKYDIPLFTNCTTIQSKANTLIRILTHTL